jgi:hypothetical protein
VGFGTLIDDSGETWAAGSADLRQRLGFGRSEFDLVGYAVRTLGFALVRQRGRSIHLSLHPALVTPATLGTLFYLLAEAMPERLLLSYLQRTWQHEVLRSAHEAMLRLEDLVYATPTWRPRSTYVVQRHPLTPRKHSALQSLGPLLAIWHVTGGLWTDRLRDLLTTLNLLERAVVLHNPTGGDRLVFDYRGASFSFYPPSWNRLAIGRDLEDQPDRDYGLRTAHSYRGALGDGQPRFEAVDAVIRAPGQDTRRSRYDRLILPWRTSDNERFLTGVSVLRATYFLESA